MSMEAKGGQCLNWRQLAGKVWCGEEEFTPVSPDGEDVLRIAKKMDAQTRTLLMGIVCAVILVSLRSLTKTRWNMGWPLCKLFSVEFEWLSNELPEFPNCWPPPSVSATLILKALSKMKCSKAAVPSGIIAGEEGVQMASHMAETIFGYSVIPSDWE